MNGHRRSTTCSGLQALNNRHQDGRGENYGMAGNVTFNLLWDGSTWLGRCCHTQSNRERTVAQLLRVKGNIVWNEHKVKSLVSVSKHHSVPHKLGCYCVSVKKHPDTFLWACCEELLNYLFLCCLSRELFSLLMKHFKDGGNPSDKEVFEASSFERWREREVTVRHRHCPQLRKQKSIWQAQVTWEAFILFHLWRHSWEDCCWVVLHVRDEGGLVINPTPRRESGNEQPLEWGKDPAETFPKGLFVVYTC